MDVGELDLSKEVVAEVEPLIADLAENEQQYTRAFAAWLGAPCDREEEVGAPWPNRETYGLTLERAEELEAPVWRAHDRISVKYREVGAELQKGT